MPDDIHAKHSADTPCCGAHTPISNPKAQDGVGRSFRVNGLDCAEEVAILNKVLAPKLGGEEHLAFDVLNARMSVLDSATPLSDEEILKAIASTGMQAKLWDARQAESDHAAHLSRQKRFTALSAAFWTIGFCALLFDRGWVGMGHLFAGHAKTAGSPIEQAAFLIAVVFGTWLVLPKAWSAARRLAPDMNLLMVIAVCGAIALGEFFEAATVAFFFALSLTLESWSVGRARNAISALLDLAPPTARVRDTGGHEQEVPASEISIGTEVIIRGGDRIPVDGQVISGSGAVDQAPITGESALVLKEIGDDVFAGTINGEGSLIVRASQEASNTVLAKITRMVSDAHSRRANVENWVTRFARIYTPIIMGLAVLIAVIPPLVFSASWAQWFYNALVLLVIACPCALVISTPISIIAALASAARQGVLIKGGAYVELPATLSALAIDKTGTLTEGKPEVVGIYVCPKDDSAANPQRATGEDHAQILRIAGALEARSSHPLAQAIISHAERETGTPITAAQDVQIIAGRGVEGAVEGQPVWLGSQRFAQQKGFDVPKGLQHEVEASGATLVAIGTQTGLLGVMALRDRIRDEAKEVITQLHALGVKKIAMLTGDNKRVAQAVAAELGIDEPRAELLPQDKTRAIEELSATYATVAMVGDGVNDAPAMARANFAIAMGAAGSDAAIETADIALMSDDITKLPWLIRHSRRTLSIIRQNIALALLTKFAFVMLTAFGMASMWGAIVADVGVSLAVVANALRLLRIT